MKIKVFVGLAVELCLAPPLKTCEKATMIASKKFLQERAGIVILSFQVSTYTDFNYMVISNG